MGLSKAEIEQQLGVSLGDRLQERRMVSQIVKRVREILHLGDADFLLTAILAIFFLGFLTAEYTFTRNISWWSLAASASIAPLIFLTWYASCHLIPNAMEVREENDNNRYYYERVSQIQNRLPNVRIYADFSTGPVRLFINDSKYSYVLKGCI